MSHAWLFTGPPGSGRSNAAIAFAAALQCEQEGADAKGCGTCPQCHTVLAGSHADVTLVRTAKLSLGVDEVRDLVRAVRHAPGRARLADHHRRGRRPADRAGLQRAAQGHRGADPAHRVDALHADDRGRPAHDPLALPAGHADHADDRGRRGLPGPRRRRRARPGGVRRARQPGTHRPRPRAGPRRGHAQPAPRDRRLPREADQPGRLHDRGGQPGRGLQGGGRAA